MYFNNCAGDKNPILTLYIRVTPVSKTISSKGCWADDDEGDEPEEKAEDSRSLWTPNWSEEVGSFCEVRLRLRYSSWSMIRETGTYELKENLSRGKGKDKDICTRRRKEMHKGRGGGIRKRG